jgi:hypothetical protein
MLQPAHNAKPASLAAVLEGAEYAKSFGCHALSMPPNQATQWSDADLETCGLTPEDIRDMRARLRGVGVGLATPTCDREAG